MIKRRFSSLFSASVVSPPSPTPFLDCSLLFSFSFERHFRPSSNYSFIPLCSLVKCAAKTTWKRNGKYNRVSCRRLLTLTGHGKVCSSSVNTISRRLSTFIQFVHSPFSTTGVTKTYVYFFSFVLHLLQA